MRIGVDFDNTIAGYDEVFAGLALEAGLVGHAPRGGKPHNVKLRVRFDAPSARYVYLTVDSSSGEVEGQYPAQESLRRIARMRQIAGLALDKKL